MDGPLRIAGGGGGGGGDGVVAGVALFDGCVGLNGFRGADAGAAVVVGAVHGRTIGTPNSK